MSDALTHRELGFLIVRFSLITVVSFVAFRWMLHKIDPTKKQKEEAKQKALANLNRLGMKTNTDLNDHEMMVAANLVGPNDIPVSWDDVAGLDNIIEELKYSVIYPIKLMKARPESRLTRPPKGVLLHGPPGCGKTLLAKATAREAGTNFINLEVSLLTDKWYGESQKIAAAVFTLATKLQPCIIFIDEIDSFLRSRTTQDHEATAMMKAQFMSFWDGLLTDPNCTVIVMGATNRASDIDAAILRRMPTVFFIDYPSAAQRQKVLGLTLKGEQLASDVSLDTLATKTDGFSCSDLYELCRKAVSARNQKAFQSYVKSQENGGIFDSNAKKSNESSSKGSSISSQSSKSPKSGNKHASGDAEFLNIKISPLCMEDFEKSLVKMKAARSVFQS